MAQVDPQSVISRIAVKLANTIVQLAATETELDDTRAQLQAAQAELAKHAPADG